MPIVKTELGVNVQVSQSGRLCVLNGHILLYKVVFVPVLLAWELPVLNRSKNMRM